MLSLFTVIFSYMKGDVNFDNKWRTSNSNSRMYNVWYSCLYQRTSNGISTVFKKGSGNGGKKKWVIEEEENSIIRKL